MEPPLIRMLRNIELIMLLPKQKHDDDFFIVCEDHHATHSYLGHGVYKFIISKLIRLNLISLSPRSANISFFLIQNLFNSITGVDIVNEHFRLNK